MMHSIRGILACLLSLAAALPLAAQLQILSNRLPEAVISAPYPNVSAFKLIATGGTPPYTYSILAGTLPPGITFYTAGGFAGSFSGTPTTLGVSILTFQVQDAVSTTASKNLTLTVNPPPAPVVWTARGLAGGDIYGSPISPDYLNDQTLFAYGYGNEIFRSTNRGANWSRRLYDPNAAQTINSLLLSPSFSMLSTANEAAQTVFVATAPTLFKSVDHGDTFTPAGSGLSEGAGAMAISPNYQTDQTLWVANYFTQATHKSIFRSLDRGLTFTQIAVITDQPSQTILQIAVSPNFAVDNTLFYIAQSDFRIFKSTDGGVNWAVVATIPDTGNPLTQLLFSPEYASDNTLFARNAKVYRSTSGGTNFMLLSGIFQSDGCAAVKRPAQTPLLFCRSFNAGYTVYFSDDAGATFTPLYSGNLRLPDNAGQSTAFAAAPRSGGGAELFSSSNLGMDHSLDDGFSFVSRDRGLNAIRFSNLSGSGALLAAGGNNSWAKSGDGGINWVRYPPPLGITYQQSSLYVSPNFATDPVIFIHANFDAVFRSVNSGASFASVLSVSSSNLAFAIAPDFNPVSGVVFATYGGGGVYRSADGGQSFAPVTGAGACPIGSGFAMRVSDIVFSPGFAVDQAVFANPGENKLCKSIDRGLTWNLVYTGSVVTVSLSPTYLDSAPNGSNAKLVMINGWQRSTDGGSTFVFVNSPLSGKAHFSPRFDLDGTILLANWAYVMTRSSDFGLNFSYLPAPDQLKRRGVTGLYLTPSFDGRNITGSVALAATNGSGMWRSTDGGRSFIPVLGYQTLSSALNAIARGPGAAPTTPILAATGDQGVFRSTDNGATFTSLSAGLPPDANARAITMPSAAPAAPVTAVNGQGLYRHNGSAWVQISNAVSGSYTSFTEDGSYLYATRSDGISMRSPDNGATWNYQDAAQTDLVNIDFNNQAGPTLIVPPAILKSGSSIVHRASSIESNKSNIDSVNTASLWSVSQAGGARYSNDSGSSWIPAAGSGDYTLPAGATYTTVRALGINAASGSREVVVGTTTGMYKTKDGGLSWRSVSAPGSGLEATSRNFSAFVTSLTPFIPATTDLLAGITGATNGGVYLSGDGGEHWTQINQGFDPNSLNITTLIRTSCSGCPVQYYSGTYGSGVYTRTIAVNAAPAFPSANAACFGTTTCTCGTTGWNGPESGGQAFKICGANFLALPAVEFDGIPATGCLWVSSSVITCTGTPLHVPGNAAVRVRNTDTRTGYLPAPYTFNGGSSRASGLLVAKAGNDAGLTYSCIGCVAPPPRVYRSQNALFTLNVEQYTGGATTYTNAGALAAGSNPTYFWSVE